MVLYTIDSYAIVHNDNRPEGTDTMAKNKSATVTATPNNATSVASDTKTETPKVDLSKYNGLSTKSSKIRAMSHDGMSRGDIAKVLGIRYQHVRNVLVQPLKRPA